MGRGSLSWDRVANGGSHCRVNRGVRTAVAIKRVHADRCWNVRACPASRVFLLSWSPNAAVQPGDLRVRFLAEEEKAKRNPSAESSFVAIVRPELPLSALPWPPGKASYDSKRWHHSELRSVWPMATKPPRSSTRGIPPAATGRPISGPIARSVQQPRPPFFWPMGQHQLDVRPGAAWVSGCPDAASPGGGGGDLPTHCSSLRGSRASPSGSRRERGPAQRPFVLPPGLPVRPPMVLHPPPSRGAPGPQLVDRTRPRG